MDVTRVVQIVVSIVGIVAIAGLIATGTNEAVLQFAGNVGGKIPLVGTWLNGISSFTKETLSGSFSGTLTAVLQMTFQCISSNILDSFFLGALISLVGYGIKAASGRWNDVWDMGTTIVVSIVGVFLLYLIKKTGEYTILVTLGSFGILLLGIGIMLRGKTPVRLVQSFLLETLCGTLEGASSVGLICSFLLLPSMIRGEFSALGIFLWMLCLVLLVIAAVLVSNAKKIITKQ